MPRNVPDEYAILSAIWILASNDENPLITYEGIKYRLTLPADYEIESLIRRHGELFRQGMPAQRLELWKTDMKAGRRVPAFIRELATPEARERTIAALKAQDGFRSQFRAGEVAPRSEVAVIEWGLNHIERLRKSQNEAREAVAKSWQIWLVLGTSILSFIATILAAVIKK